MTTATPTLERGAAVGRDGVDRAGDVIAELIDRLGDVAADAPRALDSVSNAARDIAADLPDELREMVPGASTSRGSLSPFQSLVAVAVAIGLLTLVVALIQRSRRNAERQRRRAARQTG